MPAGVAPVITSMTAKNAAGVTVDGSNPAHPGQPVTVVIVATDADGRVITLTGTVTDPEGNVSAPQVLTFPVSETPLTYALTAPTATVTQSGSTGTFTVTP